MDNSIFTDKSSVPTDTDVQSALGTVFPLWQTIRQYVHKKYPAVREEWKYPGQKYGWSFRLSDAKRVIVYLLPRDHFFKVAFVFGQKATDEILRSGVSPSIKDGLKAAKVYAEGRGIRIDIRDKEHISDIMALIDIKLSLFG